MISRIVITGIVCLFPVLVYCLILIGFNSRHRASMIPGPWDFAGVLFATSGFLLGGGPLILAGLNGGWRRFVLRGTAADWRLLSGEGDTLALGIWAAFFFAVVAGSAILLWSRRNVTVLYNVDTEHFPTAIEWVFGRLNMIWQKVQNRYELKIPAANAEAPWHRSETPSLPTSTVTGNDLISFSAAVLTVNVLPSSRNITLIWAGDESEMRPQVEAEISRLLPNIRAAENPALSWLVTTATTVFSLMLIGLIFVVVAAVRSRGLFGG